MHSLGSGDYDSANAEHGTYLVDKRIRQYVVVQGQLLERQCALFRRLFGRHGCEGVWSSAFSRSATGKVFGWGEGIVVEAGGVIGVVG